MATFCLVDRIRGCIAVAVPESIARQLANDLRGREITVVRDQLPDQRRGMAVLAAHAPDGTFLRLISAEQLIQHTQMGMDIRRVPLFV
jgi:hypothetical protein